MTERKKLVDRVAQIRDLAATPRGEHLEHGDDRANEHQLDRIRSLETRVGHLERMLEGLQDSVHRESERHEKIIAEIQAQIHPSAMRPALAEDARQRGI